MTTDASEAMPTSLRPAPRPSTRMLRACVRPCVFFTLFYLYLWLRVNPALMYHGFWRTADFPFFSFDAALFRGSVAHPGGLVEYLSAFLSQIYHYGWAGSLIISLIAALLCLTTWVFISSISATRPRALHFAPAVLLLIICGRYGNPLPVALGLLAAMACVCFYVRMPVRSAPLRLVCFLVLFAILYYVGADAALMYGVLCGIFELARKRKLFGLLYAGCAVVTFCIAGAGMFRAGLPEGYPHLMPGFPKERYEILRHLTDLFLLSFPLAALTMAFQQALSKGTGRQADAAEPTSPAQDTRDVRQPTLRSMLASSVLLVMAAVPVFLSFDGTFGTLLRIEYFAHRKMWEELLTEVRSLPPPEYDLNVNWHVNRALHYTRRLPDEMFSYPQGSAGLVPTVAVTFQPDTGYTRYMNYSDILIELGLVNESEHMANEVLEVFGNRATILQRLAVANIAKKRPEAARIFLRVLSKDIVHGKWARGLLRRLERDELLPEDEELQRIRSVMIVKDEIADLLPFEKRMKHLLERNRANRMAFEYMMAHYLLTRDLAGLADNIGRLDDFRYPDIPRHYEEALVIHRATTGTQVDLGGRTISPDTLRRLGRFREILSRHGRNRAAARHEALPEFRDSYFFYYEFAPRGEPR